MIISQINPLDLFYYPAFTISNNELHTLKLINKIRQSPSAIENFKQLHYFCTISNFYTIIFYNTNKYIWHTKWNDRQRDIFIHRLISLL